MGAEDEIRNMAGASLPSLHCCLLYLTNASNDPAYSAAIAAERPAELRWYFLMVSRCSRGRDARSVTNLFALAAKPGPG